MESSYSIIHSKPLSNIDSIPNNMNNDSCENIKKKYLKCVKKNPRVYECGNGNNFKSKCSNIYLNWVNSCK